MWSVRVKILRKQDLLGRMETASRTAGEAGVELGSSGCFSSIPKDIACEQVLERQLLQ